MSTSPSPSTSCADVALSPRVVEQGVSFTPQQVNGKNLTSAYEMRFVAAGGGRRWAGAAYDGAALWEGAERLRHIPCVTRACQPHEVAFTDGGKTLLVGVSRFDVDTGKGTALELRDALGATDMNEVESVAWSPDGKLAVAAVQHRPSRCCRDRAAPERIAPPRFLALDGATGALVKDLGERASGHGMAAGAAQVVAAARDGLTAWDRATWTPTVRKDQQAWKLLLHPGGALLASVVDGDVTLWRMPDFCPVARFTAEREHIHALAFHPTAPILFTAGPGRDLHAWSTERAGVLLGTYHLPGGHPDIDQAVADLVVTSDGQLLVAPHYMDDRVDVLAITLPP